MCKRCLVLLGYLVLCCSASGQQVHFYSQFDFSDSLFFQSRKQLLQAQATADTLAQAAEHFTLGRYFFNAGNFDKALEHLLHAEQLSEYLPEHRNLQAASKAHLGTTLYYTSERNAALDHLVEALELYETLGDKEGVADTYGRLGHYHEKTGDYDAALKCQERALSMILPKGDSLSIATVYENFGSIYEDLGDFTSAKRYFTLAADYLQNSESYFRLANVYNNLGDVYRKTGSYEEGMRHTRISLKFAQANKSTYLVKSAMRDLSKAHSELGQYDSAFYFLNVAYSALDSIFGHEVARHTAHQRVVYETEKKESTLALQQAEINYLEKERKLGRALQYTFGAAFMLLLLVSWRLFALQRQKMKKDKLIFLQREDIFKTKRALDEQSLKNAALSEARLKAELDNKRLREVFLQDQLELRSNELTSQTLKIIRKNRILNELQERLLTKSSVNNLLEIRKIIDRHLRVDKNWESFQELFEKVHHDFYKKLMEQAPDLSPAEIRLCCLIKLNMPSKDIASMLGISPDSLRIARYRLRKKLPLETKEKLGAYVMGL